MTNEEPKNDKTYIVFGDKETYAEIEECILFTVTEEGQELMKDVDGIKGLLTDYEPDGLYRWTYLSEVLNELISRFRHYKEHKEAA